MKKPSAALLFALSVTVSLPALAATTAVATAPVYATAATQAEAPKVEAPKAAAPKVVTPKAAPKTAKKAAPKAAAPEKQVAKIIPAAPVAPDFTLTDALAAAYTNNPDLEAIRAELRAVDEQHATAAAGFRPSLNASGSYTSSVSDGNTSTRTSADPKSLALTLTQSVYSGGSTMADVRQADNTIKAERARLHSTEQAVLLAAVTTYMDVLRDRQIVDLNLSNENVLQGHLDASRAQFKLGSITRTDVSQADARLAAAAAARIAAEGNLKISRAAFERVVGAAPDNLVKPALTVAVPGTLEEALTEALARNPLLVETQYNAAATHDATDVLIGGLRPAVDVTGQLSRTYDPATGTDDYVDERAVGVVATVPLYPAGGGTHARIRQSRQLEQQRRREIDSAARTVRQNVIAAWETLAAASAQNDAEAVQVKAEKLAREGVSVEAKYGSRTTLDLLDAEQEYLNAEVARVVSEHDKTVAAYSVLASVGRLTAEELKLDVAIYDPLRHYKKVKDKWAGTKVDSVN